MRNNDEITMKKIFVEISSRRFFEALGISDPLLFVSTTPAKNRELSCTQIDDNKRRRRTAYNADLLGECRRGA